MNPLVSPGDYNVTFNQYYYLFSCVIQACFWFIVLFIGLIIAWRIFSNMSCCKRQTSLKELEEELHNQLKESASIFFRLTRSLNDIQEVMGMPEKAREKYFDKEINTIMMVLLPYEDWLYKNCNSKDLILWEKYKHFYTNLYKDKE